MLCCLVSRYAVLSSVILCCAVLFMHTIRVHAGHFRILSKDNALPLVAFSLTKTVDKDGKEEARQYNEFDLADKLRQRGWVLPAYTMAPDAG